MSVPQVSVPAPFGGRHTHKNVILRDSRTNPGGSYMSVPQVSVPAPCCEGDTDKEGILRDNADGPVLGANQVNSTFLTELP